MPKRSVPDPSSDGLYQYLNNEEVVSQVESFMEKFPKGDPAQHLIEELLLRAGRLVNGSFDLVYFSCLFVLQSC